MLTSGSDTTINHHELPEKKVLRLQESLWHILVCPGCLEGLQVSHLGAICRGCGAQYEVTGNGQLDLRLQSQKQVTLTVELGSQAPEPEIEPGRFVSPFPMNPAPEVDFRGVRIPERLGPIQLSYFPRAKEKGAPMVDLGCGTAIHREVCEHAGFTYVGLDIAHQAATILGDAQALPFAPNSFDFVLSIGVLGCLSYPFAMLQEAYRVLKPGGRFFGTVPFMEPFRQTYYHLSHWGLYQSLKDAHFEIKIFGPNGDWLALRALAEMILFPMLPRMLSRAIVKPLELLHRAWWRVGEMLVQDERATETYRVAASAGSLSFVAEKPN